MAPRVGVHSEKRKGTDQNAVAASRNAPLGELHAVVHAAAVVVLHEERLLVVLRRGGRARAGAVLVAAVDLEVGAVGRRRIARGDREWRALLRDHLQEEVARRRLP